MLTAYRNAPKREGGYRAISEEYFIFGKYRNDRAQNQVGILFRI